MSIQEYVYIFSGVALAGLFIVIGLFFRISSIKVENEKAYKIADAISQGAMEFLKEEYKIIALVIGLMSLFLGYFFSITAAGVFISESICSLLCGYLGMKAATMANVRTTMAAKNTGEHAAFMIAFLGGGVMGFSVASIGLFALSMMFYFFAERIDFIILLTSFSLGASLVAFFARVGGGIYTKSADVGADLVGKIEIGIPEDDPRNPAVIADNVGDCVGDTAGMGADIYESYVSALVSSVILAISVYGSSYDCCNITIDACCFWIGWIVIGLISNLLFKTSPSAMLVMQLTLQLYSCLLAPIGTYGICIWTNLYLLPFL